MKYDVIVIGGGPAGMMAAGRAGACGARVLLLEKNDSLGKKLLITGGGRCNVTNAEFDEQLLLGKFKDTAKYLFSPFSQFGVQATLDFFHGRNMPTKTEAEKRVFPASNTAQSVWDVLVGYMKENAVTVQSSAPVAGFDVSDGRIIGVSLKSGEQREARTYIVATGGKSHPETGSTGDGFRWLKKIGHTVTESQAVLVPVVIEESWVHTLSGVSVADAKLAILQKNTAGTWEKADKAKRGKVLFTHFGLSGPLVLNMSKDIRERLQYGEVMLSLDLLPQTDLGSLDKQIQKVFEENKNKKIKNVLGLVVTPAFVSPLITRASIDPEKSVHSVSREERLFLGRTIKDMRMTVSGFLGEEKAIVTSGGVALSEVDCKTMQSRLYPNLYLVGDVLDIDRPSGGYSLQLCWTTGSVAGTHASQNNK